AAAVGHPAFGEAVGGDGGRDPFGVGQGEDLPGGVVDPGGAGLGAGGVEALDLVGDLDHAAGVDHVIRGVQDSALCQHLLDARVGELVVGAAGDHLGPDQGYGVVVEGAAERGRRVHVDVRGDQRALVGGDVDLRVRGTDPVDRGRAHVGHHDRGAVVEQVLDQVLADLADPGHADPAAGQGGGVPDVLGRGAHALEDAEGGEHRGVAGAAVLHRATGDEPGLLGHDLHVRHVRPDVAGGVVAPAERLDEPPVRPQQRLGLVPRRVAPDDGLAAAEVQPGVGVLV